MKFVSDCLSATGYIAGISNLKKTFLKKIGVIRYAFDISVNLKAFKILRTFFLFLVEFLEIKDTGAYAAVMLPDPVPSIGDTGLMVMLFKDALTTCMIVSNCLAFMWTSCSAKFEY